MTSSRPQTVRRALLYLPELLALESLIHKSQSLAQACLRVLGPRCLELMRVTTQSEVRPHTESFPA